jgi:hypothetical protein
MNKLSLLFNKPSAAQLPASTNGTRPGRPQRNGAPTRRCGESCLTMAHCVWDTMPLRNGSFRPPGWTHARQVVLPRNAGMVDIDTDATVNLDDEAREAARQKAQAERAEAEKRERRKVLALNKLGDAAMGMRGKPCL